MGSGAGAGTVNRDRKATWCAECHSRAKLEDGVLLHFADCRYYLYDMQYLLPWRLVRA